MSISQSDGALVDATSADGKVVVTLEGRCTQTIADHLCNLQTLDGMLAAALVSQWPESPTWGWLFARHTATQTAS